MWWESTNLGKFVNGDSNVVVKIKRCMALPPRLAALCRIVGQGRL